MTENIDSQLPRGHVEQEKNPIVIKQAEQGDFRAIHELTKKYAIEELRRYSHWPEKRIQEYLKSISLSEEKIRGWDAYLGRPNTRQRYIVAKDKDGRIVGFCHISLGASPAKAGRQLSLRPIPMPFFDDYVAPEDRPELKRTILSAVVDHEHRNRKIFSNFITIILDLIKRDILAMGQDVVWDPYLVYGYVYAKNTLMRDILKKVGFTEVNANASDDYASLGANVLGAEDHNTIPQVEMVLDIRKFRG